MRSRRNAVDRTFCDAIKMYIYQGRRPGSIPLYACRPPSTCSGKKMRAVTTKKRWENVGIGVKAARSFGAGKHQSVVDLGIKRYYVIIIQYPIPAV